MRQAVIALLFVSTVAAAADSVPSACRDAHRMFTAYMSPTVDVALMRWCRLKVHTGRYANDFSCNELSGEYDFEREMQQAEAAYRRCLESSNQSRRRTS